MSDFAIIYGLAAFTLLTFLVGGFVQLRNTRRAIQRGDTSSMGGGGSR